MMKKWVTIFERYEDFHLNKDVGQLPYHIQENLKYDVEIWCKEGKGRSLNSPIKIRQIKSSTKDTKLSFHFIMEIFKFSREIDVLNIFHFRAYSLLYAFIYKFSNPKGKVVLKCDGSDQLYPLSKRKNKGRLIFFLLKKINIIDLILAEHQSLVSYFSSKGLPVLHCPNGVSSDYYNQESIHKEKKRPTAIFVGKCGDERKNAKIAVEAIALLTFDCQIYFLGGETVDFKNWFSGWVSNKPEYIKSRYIFSGYINDPKDVVYYYDKAHILLMTSLHEGYPLSLSQAAWRRCYLVLSKESGGADMQRAGCADIYGNTDELIKFLELRLSSLENTIKLGEKAFSYACKNNDWRLKVKQIEERLFYE